MAFQIHRGPAMEVQIQDVMLKALPKGDVVAFNQTTLPGGTKKSEGKKRTPGKNARKKPPADPVD